MPLASIEWRVLIKEASPDAYEFRTLAAEETCFLKIDK
jgi:hypothetical protein